MTGRLLLIPDGPAVLTYTLPLLAAMKQAGATVKVAPTAYDGPSAANLVSHLAWSSLSGHPCLEIERLDVETLRWAELIVLAPATPLLARVFRDGRAAALLREAGRPVLVLASCLAGQAFEADEACRWQKALPAGSCVLPPSGGPVSLGAMGTVAAPPQEAVLETLGRMLAKADLAGRRVLVSAGPTVEDIDPVRFLSNRSSGKMGAALALAAWRRGAKVTLVHGPMSASVPELEGLERVPVRSAAQMHDGMAAAWPTCDVAIFSAAVADFTPDHYCPEKIKKVDGRSLILHLVRTADILGELGGAAHRPACLVGFAAESDDVEINALAKLRRKHCDLLCANDIRRPDAGFAVDTNAVTIYTAEGEAIELPVLPKREVAERILDAVVQRLSRKS